ncbi:MAG: rod shape-determining protein RodA [Lachnospiraceae bacterium]|nr:rod shape-determining protein RodA [Lachnospiraceae bacterium]
MFRNYSIRDYDFRLVILVALLSVIGIVAIGSADEALQEKQLLGVIAGFAMMIFISLISYNFIIKFNWVIYGVNILLLGSVLITDAGSSSNNAQRWLQIGGLRFQPSELAKILLILFFAQFIMKYRNKLNTFRIIGLCVLLVAVPWALIFKQPDLSTSIMVIIIFAFIMFAGGINWRIIAAVFAVTVPTLIILMTIATQPDNDLLSDYQKRRILAFRNPEQYVMDEAYQQNNSVIAIGSGQLNGKGYKNNEFTSVKNGNFISEDETDFIFSVIGEEFGFKGCLFVIVLIVLISVECVGIARRAKDTAGCIIAASVGGLIMMQSFINIGVTLFILPNTGLPLPFVSYGLTSLWSLYIGIGVVLNVRLQGKKGNPAEREEF